MTEDVIVIYDTFNTKWCPDETLFVDFYYQPIPPDHYDFLNDNDADGEDYDDDDDNNITGTPVDNFFPDNKGVEDAVAKNPPDTDANDEEIGNAIIMDDADSITSAIYPLQNEILEIEGVDAENEGVDNDGRVNINTNSLPPEW